MDLTNFQGVMACPRRRQKKVCMMHTSQDKRKKMLMSEHNAPLPVGKRAKGNARVSPLRLAVAGGVVVAGALHDAPEQHRRRHVAGVADYQHQRRHQAHVQLLLLPLRALMFLREIVFLREIGVRREQFWSWPRAMLTHVTHASRNDCLGL